MGYLLIILYSALLLHGLQYKWKKAIQLMIYICFFQNILLVLFSTVLNNTQFTILALEKELFLIAYLGIHIRKSITKRSLFCIISILVLFFLTIMSSEGTTVGRLSSLRQLYIPFLFFFCGEEAQIGTLDVSQICKTYLRCCLIATIFGFVEITLGTSFWVSIGLRQYTELKGVTEYIHESGLMRAFFTYDFGLPVRRMASTLADPVILGQLLGVGVLVALFGQTFDSRIKNRLYAFIIGLGLILTMAKGGIVIAIIGVTMMLRKNAKKKILSDILLIIAIISGISLIVFGFENGSSISNHYNGLISGFVSIFVKPFGYGVGSAGNMAYKGGSFSSISQNAGSESFIGSIIAQIGIIGIFLYFVFWIFLFRYGKRRISSDILYDVLRIANVGLLLTSFVNNTAISFISCFFYFVLYPIVARNNILAVNRIY